MDRHAVPDGDRVSWRRRLRERTRPFTAGALVVTCLAACAVPASIGIPAEPGDPEAGVLTTADGEAIAVRPEHLTYTGKGGYAWPGGRSYHGELVDGAPHGRGTELGSDGERYEGEFARGQRHGFGVLELADGSRYEGEFDRGLRAGVGRFTGAEGTYQGEWAGDMPHGTGVFEYPDGSRYQGQWIAAQRQGYGRYEQREGSFYEGEWVADIPHGFGHISQVGGSAYEGAWIEGRRSGYGRMTTPAGVVYEGTWKDDLREGYGREARPDGTTYAGEWRGDARHGYGVAEHLSGSSHEGEWENGIPAGPGTRRSSEGIEIIGEWRGNAASSGALRLPSGEVFSGSLYGTDDRSVDPELLRWLEAHAKAGDAHAQLLAGEAYAHYAVPARDPERAMYWYGHAAAAGLDEARYQLAQLELEHGTTARAVELLEAAAARRHGDASAALGAMYQLGTHVPKDHRRAKALYEVAIERGHAVARNNLAWLLATSPLAELRDGERAVALAAPIAHLFNEWGYFDTLAAAEAERGDFPAALRAQAEAIRLARGEADDTDMRDLEARRQLYERHEPYREP